MNENWQTEQDNVRLRIQHLFLVLLAGYLLMILGLAWWGGWRGDALLAREDNPRLVEAELRIQRGRIVDNNGIVLAENGGTLARQTRLYPQPLAEPVLGYYSLRYGTAGVEEGLDAILRGETDDERELVERDLLHLPQVGQDIRLSLDMALQTALIDTMGEETGAAVLLSLPRNNQDPIALVRALVSTPSFDPNELDTIFETLVEDENGPLLNRATQAQYQPGEILWPFLWAVAYENGDISGNLTGEVDWTAQILGLNEVWDQDQLLDAWRVWGFTTTPSFTLPTADIDPALIEIEDMTKALAGEENLLVTPLQVALATAALATDGRLPHPTLVTAIGANGSWINYNQATAELEAAVLPQTAEESRQILFSADETIIPPNVIGYTASVSAGETRYNHWFIGLTPTQAPRYILVIVVESETNQSPLSAPFAILSQIGQ